MVGDPAVIPIGDKPAVEPDPATDRELVERRTTTSRSWDVGEGLVTTELFTDPIFYRPAGEQALVPIELDFRASAKGGAVVDRSPTTVRVNPNRSGVPALTLTSTEGFEVGYTALAPAGSAGVPGPAIARGSVADVTGLLPGVDLRVSARDDGANVFLVVAVPPTDPRWSFVLDVPVGTKITADARGGLDLHDSLGVIRAQIAAPYAVDSTPDELSGGGRPTTALHYELGTATDGRPTLTVVIDDAAWLERAVYPIYVDPSVTLVEPGSNTYGDAHINAGNPGFNYANYQRPDSPYLYEMWLGMDPTNSAYVNTALVKFDISSIQGRAIDGATLQLRPYHAYYDAPTERGVWAHRIYGTWTESGVTWTNRPAWTSSFTTTTCAESGVMSCVLDAAFWTRTWLSGLNPNDGLAVDTNGNNGTYWKRLVSSENVGAGSTPHLVVTYHDPATAIAPLNAVPTNSRTVSWSFDTTDTGSTQGKYRVEVSSDNFATTLVTSGDVAGTASTWSIPSLTTLVAGTTYRWAVKVQIGTSTAWSPWAYGSFQWDPPGHLGMQPQHKFESWDLGAGDSLAVNVANTNVVVHHPIVSLPIRGSSISVDLAYNSKDSANVGVGPGWRLDAQRRLTVNGDGTITFIGPDGARSTFTAPVTVGSVTTYTRPSTLYATLAKDTSLTANEFILTYRDQSKDKFDILGSEGILVRAEDRFANGVTVSYVAGTNRIDKITDTAATPNRTIDFAYDGSNRLSSITDWAYVSGGVVQATATGSRRVTRFFYDASSYLIGWADPTNTSGSCPTGGTHLTCLTYTGGLLTAIGKTQTVETLSAGALGSTTRAITTAIAYTGGEVSTVTDAEEQSKGSPARTVFTRPAADQSKVVRPGTPATETTYGLVSASDALGRVQSVWRKFGASLIEQRTTYDGTYPIEPASVTENYGALLSTPARATSYTYVASSLGLVSRHTEPLTGSTNRTTDYTYNANNDVTQQIVALDGSGAIQTITRSCYTTSGCATNATDLLLRSTIGNYVDGTVGNGAADVEDVMTAYLYDAYGQRTRETRSNYNAAGTLLDSAASGSVYDDKGNLTASIANYANGTVTNPGDDITPNATSGARTDLTTASTYDAAGNQISSADRRRAIETAKGTSLNADDFVTRTEYNALGQATKETAARTPGDTVAPKFSTTSFDELGGVREATDFGGLVSGTESDRAGRATQRFEDPDGAGGTAGSITTQTTYDAVGRSLTSKDRLQVATSSLGYTLTANDELGRTTDVTEANASSPDIATITHTTYDALDRQATQTVGHGGSYAQTTTTSYDLGGRVLSTDDEFTCVTATFDYRDLALTQTTGLVGGTCASGSETRTITHTLDRLGRQIRSEVTSSGSPDFGDRPFDVTFDAAGRQLTSATRKGGTTSTATFTLDPLDEVLVEARPDGSTAKTAYDPAGNATDRCYWKPSITVGDCLAQGTTPWTNPPTQVTTTAYDGRNSRIELRDSAASTTTTYDPAHGYQISALYLPTGTLKEHQTLYGYDARHRVITVTTQLCTISTGHACSSTTATGSDTYAYDDNDNRTTVVEANGATSSDRRYCYDGLNRLRARQTTATCTTTSGDETYTYDDPGNRQTAPGATYSYDSTTGQLTGCSPACGTVSSDSAGNLKQFNGWTYEYDAENRLVRACEAATCATGSPDKVEFSYDGEGHRTQIKEYTAGTLTTTRDFRYQGDAIVEESTNGTVSRGYIVDDVGRILKVCDPSCASPTTTYLVSWNGHGDALGLWQINGNGTLTLANSYTYSTWGTPTTAVATGADLKFRFLYVGAADVQWDDFSGLGLTYMHARHYGPAIGRFLQPDPARADANMYAYAGDSPVTGSDPWGLVFPSGAPQALRNFCASSQAANIVCAIAISAQQSAERRMYSRWPRMNGQPNPSWSGGRADAFRHCCWNGFMVRVMGTYWAKRIADDLYEMNEPLTSTNTIQNRNMDLSNNAVGRSIGARVPQTWRISYLWGWQIGRTRALDLEMTQVENGCLAGLGGRTSRYASLRWLHS